MREATEADVYRCYRAAFSILISVFQFEHEKLQCFKGTYPSCKHYSQNEANAPIPEDGSGNVFQSLSSVESPFLHQ